MPQHKNSLLDFAVLNQCLVGTFHSSLLSGENEHLSGSDVTHVGSGTCALCDDTTVTDRDEMVG